MSEPPGAARLLAYGWCALVVLLAVYGAVLLVARWRRRS